MLEGLDALQVDNILHVAGLTPFGVFVLYCKFVCVCMCVCVYIYIYIYIYIYSVCA